MSRFVDAIIVYRILRKLSTPFKETEAYRLGIIDDKGKILRKFGTLNSPEERDAYTLLDRLVWRMKRMIERLPFENSKLASFATALALIKEHHDKESEPLPSVFETRFKSLNEGIEYTAEMQEVESFFNSVKSFKMHLEDFTVVNSVGGGFSAQGVPDPNPNLAGRDLRLGKKLARRKKPNV
jgi:hypothetical protein